MILEALGILIKMVVGLQILQNGHGLPHANTREAELAYRHAFFTRLPAKHSGELQPVLIWRAGHADYKGIVREELVDIMIKAFVVHLEVPCFLD